MYEVLVIITSTAKQSSPGLVHKYITRITQVLYNSRDFRNYCQAPAHTYDSDGRRIQGEA